MKYFWYKTSQPSATSKPSILIRWFLNSYFAGQNIILSPLLPLILEPWIELRTRRRSLTWQTHMMKISSLYKLWFKIPCWCLHFSFQVDKFSDLYSVEFWNFDELDNFRQFRSKSSRKKNNLRKRNGLVAENMPQILSKRKILRKRVKSRDK